MHSFRDPGGVCFAAEHRMLRLVNAEGLGALEQFLNSTTARQWIERRVLIPTRRLPDCELARSHNASVLGGLSARTLGFVGVFEHERVAFPSYPFEWPPEMLFAAGALTLELAEEGLKEGFGLKDATPYNVLFRGTKPVFIDLLSFEMREPGDTLWKPYAQFVRTFLLPLLVNRGLSIPLTALLTTHRDGLEPQLVYRMCGPLRRLCPPFLGLVSIPVWLASRTDKRKLYGRKPLGSEEKARFIIRCLLRRSRRTLQQLKPPARGVSAWANYMDCNSYSEAAFAAKAAFVQEALDTCRPGWVLDVGANTGHFSLMAARAGAQVVAIDTDAACVGTIWQRASAAELNVLPLVVDLARPSPGIGWRNRECLGFLERASGRFDAVLMLAVLHHLLVTDRVPLNSIMELASELTRQWLIVEFVPPEDPMFEQLLRGRDSLFRGFTRQAFEQVCRGSFQMVRQLALPASQRVMYLLKKIQ